MTRYVVTVRYELEREISVYARDERRAEEKAVDIVMGWSGVIPADAEAVTEA